jgi:hypothetical protein
VTGDGVADLVFVDFGYPRRVHILICNGGRFEQITPKDIKYIAGTDLMFAGDFNKNGLNEIVIESYWCSGTGCQEISVIEWNGNEFKDLFWYTGFEGLNHIEIKNLDQNGTSDIVTKSGILGASIYVYGYPWRQEIRVFKWNGAAYVLDSTEYTPPIFRFQAVQDGDAAFLNKQYDKAISFYQQAIFNSLDWWSKERKGYFVLEGTDESLRPTPLAFVPKPVFDSTEYPRLAAYAYYRMVILHTFIGQMDSAHVKYVTLQEKFPAGNPGHPYVEMVSAFWDAYQSSGKMYNACAAAIAYADAHPEILTPLGSDYHGAQSHKYVPVDVCPFR